MQYSKQADQEKYPFSLPDLPFAKDDLNPHFTAETFDYHHGKHHNAYVVNLNNMLEHNQEMSDETLENIIIKSRNSNMAIFNNAAQIWNHTFFWHSIKPGGGGKPSGAIAEQIDKDFGAYEAFAEEFKQAAISQFGSGWAWLVYKFGKLSVMKTANAETPITDAVIPLLNCDVWEHAYYVDYRNKRPDYVSVVIDNMLNWDFAEENFQKAKK